MDRVIEIDVLLPHPPTVVWNALTDPSILARWLMERDLVATVGHRFRFTMPPQRGWRGTVDCVVTVVDPPRSLAYTWQQGTDPTQGEWGDAAHAPTLVTWTLVPEPAGTRLRLEHSGFAGLGEVALSHVLERGWRRMLEEALPRALATD